VLLAKASQALAERLSAEIQRWVFARSFSHGTKCMHIVNSR
jgi:hypothetical protein